MTLSFETLQREKRFVNPSSEKSEISDLHDLIRPHIDSFDAIFDQDLLQKAIRHIETKQIIHQGKKLRYWIDDVIINKPILPDNEKHSSERFIYPNECRERAVTYKSKMLVKLAFQVDDNPVIYEKRPVGNLPIMVKSVKCNIRGMSPKELIKHREEGEELGGYFIINGIERIIRLLIVQRRNHVLALVRPSFTKRGPFYTHFGASIRCVRDDQSSQTITLHYLSDGTLMVRFHMKKQEYLIPYMLILKALYQTNDKAIYEMLIQNNHGNTFLAERIEMLLRSFKSYQLFTREQCLSYLGSKFRIAMHMPEDLSDQEIGQHLLNKMLFVHLDNDKEKMNLLIFMAQKLYALVAGEITADNPDSPMHQEVLLSGFLYMNYLKEKLEDYMAGIFMLINQQIRNNPAAVDFTKIEPFLTKNILLKAPSDIGRKLENFLATGNLTTLTGMDLQQATGYTIVAEKLNYYRYIAHFRSIHRGSFFAELKTTTVRKLLPEAWGFLCPVHTPDGSPCGLLNHLAHKCKIITNVTSDLDTVLSNSLSEIGMTPLLSSVSIPKGHITIHLNGKWIGSCSEHAAAEIEKIIRNRKVNDELYRDLEMVHIPVTYKGLYPGIYFFTGASRMLRPVKPLNYYRTDKLEYIGSLEQVYMNIACVKDDIIKGLTTHIEVDPTNMLSVIASLTPFSDFNQSPRNMYQCQMGKQSMGTPTHCLPYRSDNKLYKLNTGQTPLVRPGAHLKFGMDDYPNGMNAVVAVICYTGYDMEDAMILNKSAFERGFGHGTIYKSDVIDLTVKRSREGVSQRFQGKPNSILDEDGLPKIGSKLSPGDYLCSIYDETTQTYRFEKYKGFEDAIVDQVTIIGDDTGDSELQKVNIKLRIIRNPVIGDKFSSRHGQKGVCSQKWPLVNMPFTESGMTPDIIINPHAFPSRMTIGMFVESMAGKSAALNGLCQDATPFKFNEEYTAVEYFGEQLKKSGYNYYGNEPMYSGITGQEMKADIYIGCVYYQRLRHMVGDKFQVRTTGPVDNLTQQPIKGRKRSGGIRFGEMERDSLLAHGVSFMLHDRLMNCSDYSHAYICTKCKNFLSTMKNPENSKVECRFCETETSIDIIAIPYVFRYLATELMAMNIRLSIETK
jgi:DNA-directed RNA polymerase I subunit RPA2